MKRLQIGIIGPEAKNLPKNKYSRKIMEVSYKIGKLIAKNNIILITGGCSGVMEEASRGAATNNGIIVGTPGKKRFTSNKYVNVEICTPIDVGDYIFAGILSSDSIIVLPGDAGTLAELAIAYRYKKPLIFIKGFEENMLKKLFPSFDNKYPIYIANDEIEAVSLAIKSAKDTLPTKEGKSNGKSSFNRRGSR